MMPLSPEFRVMQERCSASNSPSGIPSIRSSFAGSVERETVWEMLALYSETEIPQTPSSVNHG